MRARCPSASQLVRGRSIRRAFLGIDYQPYVWREEIRMSTEAWVAAGFGILFVMLLFGTALYLIGRQPRDIPEQAMWILRVILALAGAAMGAVMAGLLTVQMKVEGVAIQATSGFALFVLIYLVNPPKRFTATKSQQVDSGGKGVQINGNNNKVDI